MSVAKWSRAGAVAAVLALAAWGTHQARANYLVPQLESVTPDGSAFTYTYQIDTTPGSEIHSGTQTSGTALSPSDGDYLGIFDIPGYVGGSEKVSLTQPLATVGGGTWVATQQLLGLQPDPSLDVTVTDNAGLYNVDFQYVGTDGGNAGPQTIYASNPPLTADPNQPGQLVLGDISFDSTNPLSATPTLHYSAQDTDSTTQLDESNQGRLLGPSLVPEPATGVLLACCIGAVILAPRPRRA